MKPASTSARLRDSYRISPEEAVEPKMSTADWADFQRAVALFNRGSFWESHEAWEQVWRRHSEPSRLFFQALIQLAAGYHHLQRGVYHGVVKHLNNALYKLQPFPAVFLRMDVAALRRKIEAGLAQIQQLGEHRLDQFDTSLIAKLHFTDEVSPL